jgi:RTX calcium-binding nonapeptide repeat (4 copies)
MRLRRSAAEPPTSTTVARRGAPWRLGALALGVFLFAASGIGTGPAMAAEASVAPDPRDGALTLFIFGESANESTTVDDEALSPNFWEVVTAPPVGTSAGPGCQQVSDIRVRCDITGVTRLYYDSGGGSNTFGVFQGVNTAEYEIWGGDGHDGINFSPLGGAVFMDLGAGDDNAAVPPEHTIDVEIHGGDGHDFFYGGGGNDLLTGGGEVDVIEGRQGADEIDLGEGNDLGQGGTGNDVLIGDFGDDILAGGGNDDSIYAGPGLDRVGSDHRWSGNPFSGSFILPNSEQPEGADDIFVQDGQFDSVLCAGGSDWVEADLIDALGDACEDVVLPAGPAPSPGPGPGPTPGPGPSPGPGPGLGPGASPGPGPSPSGDNVAPVLANLTTKVQRLTRTLRRGLSVTLSTSEACTSKTVVLGKAKLLRRGGGTRNVVLGRRTTQLEEAGKWQLSVPFSATAKKRLSLFRTVQLVVRITVVDGYGNATTTTRKVTLRS